MKKLLKFILPILFTLLLSVVVVLAANSFPTTLNNWSSGDVIEEDWGNALEDKIGVDNSSVTSSLDYLLRNTSSSNPGHKHTLSDGSTDVTATSTELNYVSGVTSAIQTQIDSKGVGDALVANPLSQFATTTSLQLKGVISNEIGSGLLVFATSPTFTTSIVITGGATIDADGIDLVTGNDYEINGTAVLNATTLGGAVVSSSLTSVGTLTGLTMAGNIVMADNSVTGIDTLIFTDTAGTIAGIQNQNLLDKSATETITGIWTVENTSASGKAIQIVKTSSGAGGAQVDFRAHGSSYSETLFDNSMTDATAIISQNSSVFVIGNFANGPLVLGTNNAERMRIEGDGGIFFSNLLAASASTDVNINGSNELHSVTSSIRFKENITDVKQDTSAIYDLVVREYDFKKEFGGGHEVGIIAEEAIKVLPQLVVSDKDGIPYSFQYSRLSVFLLAEMQELKKEIEILKLNNVCYEF